MSNSDSSIFDADGDDMFAGDDSTHRTAASTPRKSPAGEAGETEINVSVPNADLIYVGARPPLGSYIRGLYQRRYFIVAESRAKAHGSIKGTALGKLWLILEPFLNAGIYYLIFAVLLQFDRGMDNFVAYLVIGVSFFGFLSRHVGSAANIIPSGKNLIRAFTFPRASLVFSFTLRQILDFLPTMFATILFIVVIPPHVMPSWTWLLFPLVFLLAIPFAMGIAFISATLTTLVKDLKFIWPLVTRFWFYGSGVFWSVTMFDNPVYQDIMMANPGWVFLELSRQTLAWGEVPPLGLWLYFGAWSIGMFAVGFLVFWSQEEKFGEVESN